MGLFVFFDVGGTLLYFRPSYAAAVGGALRALGSDVSDEGTAIAVEAAWRRVGAGPDGALLAENHRWWRAFLEAIVSEAGCPDRDRCVEALWRQHRAGDWLTPADDARATLERLSSAGHRLGVISNWDDTLEAILGRRGLLDLFEVVVVSTAVGAAKPDERIFRAALDAARVEPTAAVHVGDEPIADVEGARAVGIRPVLIGDRPSNAERIATLSELLALPGLAGHPNRAR